LLELADVEGPGIAKQGAGGEAIEGDAVGAPAPRAARSQRSTYRDLRGGRVALAAPSRSRRGARRDPGRRRPTGALAATPHGFPARPTPRSQLCRRRSRRPGWAPGRRRSRPPRRPAQPGTASDHRGIRPARVRDHPQNSARSAPGPARPAPIVATAASDRPARSWPPTGSSSAGAGVQLGRRRRNITSWLRELAREPERRRCCRESSGVALPHDAVRSGARAGPVAAVAAP